ncbi:MAG TPA: SagB family peptide dehydrogenase [Kofleriaceae bacterium]|nr:SagB family peptide dehydrogenase [Kofleriaceae bacterium]
MLAPGAVLDAVLRVHRLPAAVAGALAALVAGAGEDALVDQVRRAGGDAGDDSAVARLHVALDRLLQAGALHVAVRAGDRTLAVLEPMSPAFRLRPADPPLERRLRLSRFACLRRDGDALVLDSPRVHARLVVGDPAAAAVIAALAAPTTLRAIGPPRALVALLARAGFAVEVDAGGRSAEDRDPPLAGWEFHDLWFHARSQRGRHRGDIGATYRLAGIAPPPVVAPLRGPASRSPTGPGIDLPRADLAAAARADPPLAAVMEARRSTRAAGARPIALAQLGELLDRCVAVRSLVPGERDEVSRRPYPSAGARYPLEIYVVARACDSLAPGLHHYDPLGHRLETLRSMNVDVEALLAGATVGSAPPQVVLVLAARFLRVSWKYASIAYALVLQEAGIVTQSLYLAATAMRLAACAVGGTDSEGFARAAGVDPDVEGSIAAIALGSLPSE